MRVTRADVARRAGVSTAVVSYVINNGPRPVSEDARRRVTEAIDELGYRPDAVARALQSRRTWTLGLVVPELGNPFFAELSKAIEDEAFALGYSLLVGNAVEQSERETEYVRNLLERRIDGLMLVSVATQSNLAPYLASGTPVVVLDRIPDDLTVSSVIVDNRGGAQAATEHLLRHGHQRVGIIAGPGGLSVVDRREQGWRDALEAAGETADELLIARQPFTRQGGWEAARQLLQGDDPPTALFVCSDVQAIGALRCAASRGLRVPEDLAIVSFDGTEESRFTVPALTTVTQPIGDVAREAVAILHSSTLQKADDQSPTHVELAFSLHLSESCGCGTTTDETHGKGSRKQ